MSRIFNGREIELLAPAGTFGDFLEILHSRADAFYLGGKKFNMRVHKAAHNFTDEEIGEAIRLAHEAGKKIYITFNNMMDGSELEEAVAFLKFLESVKPDALIIQDFGAVKLIRDLGLGLELHLSVMANVHNAQMVEEARELGITRVVLSREMPLHEISRLRDHFPDMEYEYFTHGDMCSVHGAQCLYSGVLFGKSSNRGQCMKPCRWAFQGPEGVEYPFAVKDLSFYRHLPQLLDAGVNSFKIEGRMRGAGFLVDLIDHYGEAMDRYLENPSGYFTDPEKAAFFHENRVRNLSTAYGFKTPGRSNIDLEGLREPRVFSLPKAETDASLQKSQGVMEVLGVQEGRPLLSVSCNDLESLKAAVDAGADRVYIPGEVFRPRRPFTLAELEEACRYGRQHGAAVYYSLPRMTDRRQFGELDALVPKLKEYGAAGLLVSNLGQVRQYKDSGLELIGDYGLNVYNKEAAAFYQGYGLSSITLSLEAGPKIVRDLLGANPALEVVVQGAPTLMYLEHCLKAAQHHTSAQDWCLDHCMKESMDLVDERGHVRKVRADQFCKNHVIPTKDFCYLPVLNGLRSARSLRIEGRDYPSEVLGAVTALYRQSLDGTEAAVETIAGLTGNKQSLQALNHLN